MVLGTQIFGTLVMASAHGVRGAGRCNCGTVCCVAELYLVFFVAEERLGVDCSEWECLPAKLIIPLGTH